ncbi:MAG: glycosyl hydrolase family 18 protein [Candidatus Methanoperedens sp.]|nr:glycosyl hydrolase family 18 protein [Candidatus Methanoperedens sp.]
MGSDNIQRGCALRIVVVTTALIISLFAGGIASAATPDLTVTSMSFTPSSATTGQSISVTFTIKNQGGSSSGAFYNRISLGTSAYGTTYSLGNFYMSSLAAGASNTVTVTTNAIPASVPAGSYYVTVFTDSNQGITESNENNNIGSSDPNKITVSQSTPDLTVTSVSIGTSSATTGQTFSVTYTIKNIGGAASGSFSNRISLGTSVYGTTYSLGDFSMGSLAAGASNTVTVTTNAIPASVPAGSYYVTVFTDSNQGITESNENNNIGSSDPNKITIFTPVAIENNLSKLIYAFWPYWTDPSSYQPDWKGLTHVAYHSWNAKSDGTLVAPIDINRYNAVKNVARQNGVKVIISVTSFDAVTMDSIFAYHRENLANNILYAMQTYGADGVNIDFEFPNPTNTYTHTSNSALFEEFMQILYTKLKSANLDSHISIDVSGGVEGVYRNGNLAQYVDAIFLMGYDYHWSKDTTTGAVSPYNAYNDPYQLDVDYSVNLLKKYYPSSKIILGLPLYGYDWPSSSSEQGASTIGNGATVQMKNAIANAQTYGRLWDSNSNTPWYRYKLGDTWHQTWYDDDESLGLKLDYVNSENIGGAGFWALGYEGNNANIWNVVKSAFSAGPTPTPTPTSTPTANVSISGFSFQPQTINVAPGTSVTWTNLDSTLHTVTSDTGLFDSGSLSNGQTFSRTFNVAGNYDYHCNFHSFMTGRVAVSSAAVTPTPTPSPTPTPTPTPTISVILITPSSGPVGAAVSIGGSGFVSGATVKFGNVTATSSVVTSTIISAIVPTLSAGTYDVKVTNPDGSFGVLPNAFTVTGAPALVASIAPSSRVAQVGSSVTLLVSVVNYGSNYAQDVQITQHTSLPVNINFKTWDGLTNFGQVNAKATIKPGNGVAFFVLDITPTSSFPASSVTFDIKTTNGTIVSAPITQVNTFTLAASNTPSADIVMMSTTTDVSASINVPGAFAIATSNVGNAAGANVSLVVDAGTMPIAVQGKQTNPTTGAIIGNAQNITIGIGGQPTFAVFYTPTGAIANDPGNNRIKIKLVDSSGNILGSQSVAIHT